jgi:hypothetical protein
MQWLLLLLRGSWVFPFLAHVPALLGPPERRYFWNTEPTLNVCFMETLDYVPAWK